MVSRPPTPLAREPHESAGDAIRRAVDEGFELALTELMAYLRIPSLSQEGRGIEEAAEFLAGLMERCGVRSRIIRTGGHPVVYGELSGNGAEDRRRQGTTPAAAGSSLATILIYGHYDVQSTGPDSAWTTPPFEPSVRHGRLYARGVGDNKGQHLAHLMALAALRRHGLLPPARVKFLIEGEEEIGSPSLEPFVRDYRELLDADLLFAADGPMHPSGRPTLYLGARGLLKIELRLRGAVRDLHSGNFGGLVPNPAQRLVACLASLFDSAGRPAVAGFFDDVEPPGADDLAHLAGLPFDAAALAAEIGLPPTQLGDPGSAMRRLLYEPLINVHLLQAGSGASAIPAAARAALDVRLVPRQRCDRVVHQLRAHLASHGFSDVELTVAPGQRNPARTSRRHPAVGAVAEALRRAYGAEPVILPNLGATVPCDIFAEQLGISGVWVAYANHDERNHAPDENLGLDELRCAMRATALVLHGLAGMPPWRVIP